MRGSDTISHTWWAIILLCSILCIISQNSLAAQTCTDNSSCPSLSATDGCNSPRNEIVNNVQLPICTLENGGTTGSCNENDEGTIVVCADSSCTSSGSETYCNIVNDASFTDVTQSDLNTAGVSKTETITFCSENYLCNQQTTISYVINQQTCTGWRGNRFNRVCNQWSVVVDVIQTVGHPSCSMCPSGNTCVKANDKNIIYTFQADDFEYGIPQATCGAADIVVTHQCEDDSDCMKKFPGRTRLNTTDKFCDGPRRCSQDVTLKCISNICNEVKSNPVCSDCPQDYSCALFNGGGTSLKYGYCKYTPSSSTPTELYWNGMSTPQPNPPDSLNNHFTQYTTVSPSSDLLGGYIQIFSINPLSIKAPLGQKESRTTVTSTDLVCNMQQVTHFSDDALRLTSEPSAVEICNSRNAGLEGNYNITLEADGPAGGYSAAIPSSITFRNLEVDWNKLKGWCTIDACGNGDWLEEGTGVPRVSRCCSAREMDPSKTRKGIGTSVIINYTNEDCNLRAVNNMQLCYFNANPTSESISQGDWLDATNNSGEIVYEGCGDINTTTNREDGFEYVANLNKWVQCNSGGFDSSPISPVLFITGYDTSDIQKTHGFICVNRLAPLKNSILECIPDGSFALDGSGPIPVDGGVHASRGTSANLSSKAVYFCAEDASWSTDFDNPTLAGSDGAACNAARFPTENYPGTSLSIGSKWTGSLCCGELDDWRGTYPENAAYAFSNSDYTQREYYNDPSSENKGACFNGVYQQNEGYLTLKYKNYSGPSTTKKTAEREVREVIVWNGTFQGCAIDHSAALTNKQLPTANLGKVSEQITCANPKDLTLSPTSNLPSTDKLKPYDGSLKDFSNLDYGYVGSPGRRNDFLNSLKNYPNPKGNLNSAGTSKLITDNEYCNIKNISGDKYYYCSYKEVWNLEDISENVPQKTHLSFIPWVNNSAQQAECCAPTECWDGMQCVGSVYDSQEYNAPYKVMNSYGDGFICKEGSWEWTYNKMTWDGSESGYCYENTQCLVSPGGTLSQKDVFGPTRYSRDILEGIGTPRCINDSEYYNDHYCENGTWTSRTKFLAAAMQKIATENNQPYTLYCDSYEKVLNRYDYALSSAGYSQSVQSTYFIINHNSGCNSFGAGEGAGVQTVPCANHVCVLIIDPSNSNSANRKVYVGTSINSRLNKTMSGGEIDTTLDFGSVFGSSLVGCVGDEASRYDAFKTCNGGNNKLYYHGKLGLVLYSQEPVSLSSTSKQSYFTILQSIFNNPILYFVNLMSTSSNEMAGFDYSEFQALAYDLLSNTVVRKPFDCQNNCTNNNGNSDYVDDICGERGNPRQIFDLSTLYFSKSGSKEIFGIAELQNDKDDGNVYSYSALRFTGFTQDNICATFKLPLSGVKCIQNSGLTTVIFNPQQYNTENSFNSIVDLASLYNQHWVFVGPSSRIGAESASTS